MAAGDLEQQGSGWSQGGAAWDELTEPLPLAEAANADAAQFYTVLVVDEAVEEYNYRCAAATPFATVSPGTAVDMASATGGRVCSLFAQRAAALIIHSRLPACLPCLPTWPQLLLGCRHMDSPWIWQFPSKLAGTPKKSAKAVGNLFGEVTRARVLF